MSRFKGWVGEKKTALKMWLSLNKKTYPRFHDVILPYKNGTAQLDHLVVSIYGLFIIETKNKEGWIFGSADKATWTQTFYNKKFSFQNPLRQTFRQKKVLADFLEIDESLIHPVVYFNGDCSFKTPMPDNVLQSGLGRYIKRFQTPMITPEQVENMVNILNIHISNSSLSTKDHIQSLQERQNSDVLCPKCGSLLVMRTVKIGTKEGRSFLGCSGYPKCKFTKDIDPLSNVAYLKTTQKSSKTKSSIPVPPPMPRKPSFKEWLEDNPGKSINDYYSRYGN
jgi:hypothetical protein